jgi:hypothetical protein
MSRITIGYSNEFYVMTHGGQQGCSTSCIAVAIIGMCTDDDDAAFGLAVLGMGGKDDEAETAQQHP